MQTGPNAPQGAAASGRAALATGFVAALLASTCCLGPLVLISIGFSGAWVSRLTALEPYRPIFIGAALVALLLAGRQLWAKTPSCEPQEPCAAPSVRRGYKLLFWVVAALVIVAVGFPWVAPWFY
jgi:mercuric ion transport protein